jgi:hypothetical protein
MKRALRLVGIAVLFFALSAAHGWAAEWVLTRVTGVGWIVPPRAEAQEAVEGQTVPEGWTVATGPQSRILLMRGEESISLGPESRVALWQPGAATVVAQTQGVATFDVEHRPLRSFTVETPVLAAAVKGTQFTVTVTDEASSVHVTEGSVQVKVLATGDATLLGPSQGVIVYNVDPTLLPAPSPGAAGTPLLERLGGGVSGIGEALAGTVGEVIETLGDLVGQVLEPLAGETGEIVEETLDAAEGAVEEILSGVTDIVDGVVGGIGGALGL